MGTHLTSRNPCPCLCTPTRYQKTQGMAGTKQNTCEEGPLLTPQPLVVLDVVGIGEQRVEWKKRDCVYVLPAGYRDTEISTRYFWGDYGYVDPMGGIRNHMRTKRGSNSHASAVFGRAREDASVLIMSSVRPLLTPTNVASLSSSLFSCPVHLPPSPFQQKRQLAMPGPHSMTLSLASP